MQNQLIAETLTPSPLSRKARGSERLRGINLDAGLSA
jgi:hypothetical protein